jgi:adenylate cyclase
MRAREPDRQGVVASPDSGAVTDAATVLIVDDEARVLDSLEALLAMSYRILRAERPEAALEILKREDVALIISDQRMPGLTGTELLARSLEVSPDSVRVLLTAFTDVDALMESINAANIYHFILKPWDPKELAHLVRRGVERYRLTRERALLVRDLAAKNQDLETTLADLRIAQERAVREAAVRAQLQRYVSPRLVDLALETPALLELPGDWREATILFADIRDFTALVETTPAPVVIRLLDEYFSAMIDVIFRHQGTVEQLIGDEIVALFGITEGGQEASARAVRTAIDMVATVQTLSARWKAAGLPTFDIGVGLSSGPVWAATIGSDRRRELIVVGRPMIAAARIQRMTRQFDVHIIAADATFREVADHVRHRGLGTPKLKGIKGRQALYEILGLRDHVAADVG